MAAAGHQRGEGQSHTAQTAARGEGFTTMGQKMMVQYLLMLYSMTSYSNLVQVFLVRRSAALQRKVLSVRLKEDKSRTPISHFPIRESQYSKSTKSQKIIPQNRAYNN